VLWCLLRLTKFSKKKFLILILFKKPNIYYIFIQLFPNFTDAKATEISGPSRLSASSSSSSDSDSSSSSYSTSSSDSSDSEHGELFYYNWIILKI